MQEGADSESSPGPKPCGVCWTMNALATYLHGLRDVRAYGAGVKEQSYKPKLAELLSAVGGRLKP